MYRHNVCEQHGIFSKHIVYLESVRMSISYEGLIKRSRTTETHIKTQRLITYRASRQEETEDGLQTASMVVVQGKFPEAIK